MKIKLNEKDKKVIKGGTVFAVSTIDSIITGAGCSAIGMLTFGVNKKGVGFGAVLVIANAMLRANGEYYDVLRHNTDRACNWIFNKLENSDKKVVEFEK